MLWIYYALISYDNDAKVSFKRLRKILKDFLRLDSSLPLQDEFRRLILAY